MKDRLNVIERKVDKLKEKLDGSEIDDFQRKLQLIINKLDALKK